MLPADYFNRHFITENDSFILDLDFQLISRDKTNIKINGVDLIIVISKLNRLCYETELKDSEISFKRERNGFEVT